MSLTAHVHQRQGRAPGGEDLEPGGALIAVGELPEDDLDSQLGDHWSLIAHA
jgi:hypothetical protein